MTYSEKLKDPRWQKKRLKIMEYAAFRCQMCGAKDKTLHVHHSYYTNGKAPWQYPDGSLICICEPCHGKIHPEKKKEAPQAPKILIEEIPAEDQPPPGWTMLDSMALTSKVREKMIEEIPLCFIWITGILVLNVTEKYVEFMAKNFLSHDTAKHPPNLDALHRVTSSLVGRPVEVRLQ